VTSECFNDELDDSSGGGGKSNRSCPGEPKTVVDRPLLTLRGYGDGQTTGGTLKTRDEGGKEKESDI